ncbi:unannotated protein [freshwater metagenome]|uniref:Unannotated protein n=1 Tax=freshwater metagenome TaxID=449393 RepID=A0A6J7F123_9ZZZZ|nr:glyoxalase [Actinomycetota bacterium]
MTTVAAFVVAADADAWRRAGFAVDGDGLMRLGGIQLRLIGAAPQAIGIETWELADAPDPGVALIDGLRTTHGDPPDDTRLPAVHPNGTIGIDHVVIYTPDLETTCAAITAATGAPLKRIREVGALRQGFHRLGELIVEVVTYPEIAVHQATFWGLALNVGDIDAMFASLGAEVMSPPKDAVQPGRRISSFRDTAGLGVPVAVMTTHGR